MFRALVTVGVAVALLAASTSARPHHRRVASHKHPLASTMSFGSVPHSFLSAAEFAKRCESDPTLLGATTKANPNARSFYRAGSVIPMQGGFLNLGFYYVNISINEQQFQMLLDTGSSNLAVPGPQCSTCGGDSNTYDYTKSPTAAVVPFASEQCAVCAPDGSQAPNCPFGNPFAAPGTSNCGYGISYGGGSSFLSGFLVNEVVSFGQYTVPTTIIVMTDEYPNGSFSSSPVDGILGLAHEMNAVNPTWAPTIFGTIVRESNPPLPNLFSVCLNPTAGGEIDVGFADDNKYTGELQWIPQVQERWYNMELININIASSPLDVPPTAFAYVNDQIGAFIDSGTSIILICPLAFTSFTTIFQQQYGSLPGVSGASNLFTGACVSDSVMGNQLSNFPTLNFMFRGENGTVTLSVGPTAYLMHAGGQYCLGVQGVVGIGAVLGDVFMQNFYIVHDRDNQRIGFAPVQNCGASN